MYLLLQQLNKMNEIYNLKEWLYALYNNRNNRIWKAIIYYF
jgi:hypothetical protein